MEAPISASQGAMRSLPRKLESLLSGSKHKLREVEKKKLRVLQADLQEIIDKYLIEPSEVVFPASTANSWMKDVRDLSYDIDDFIYELAHVVGGGARISVVQKPPRFKVSLFPEKLRRRRWVTDEISRLRTRVEEAIRLHKECLGNCKWRPIITGQPPPSPCGRLVGVDSSIQQLCDLLANDGQPGHRVVSIVGPGGVGKTTLAREVYRRLGGQFQCLAFVRTSPKADMKGLLTSLLSQVRRRRHVPDDALDVHKLVVNINEHLRDKTYLIVIEDLWALSTWDLVNRALPKGNSRSRILTTTEVDVIAQTCCADNCKFIPAQKEDISKYIPSEKEDKPKYMPSKEKNIPMYMRIQIENNSKYIIKKEPLSEDESRELFSNRAFGKQAECPPGIKEVSSEIIKKSGGLPLGISILAGLLAHHPASSIEQWNYINNSLSSDLAHASFEKIYQVLNIAYDNLPHHLKACMLYLCLYEEDCIIWKDDLVKQWIAEGFISVVTGEDEEEVARSYFGELVNRGIIQPVDTNCRDEIMSCRVHHMVLHFIRDKSMEENFCIVINHFQTTIRLADKVRRLALHLGGVEHATAPWRENMRLSKVRSVSFFGFHKCMPSVAEFRFLQVLNLKLLVYHPDNMMTHNLTGSDDPSGADDLTDNLSEPYGFSYNLTEISELLRLRYFYLDACNMRVALPTQMQQLKDLVAWEIDAEVAAVPSDIVDMPSLLYLRIPSKAHLPTGIGRMTSLRTLGVLDLSKNSTEDVMSLTGLTNLQNLRLTCCTLQPDNLEKNLECLGTVIPKLSNLKCVTLVPAVSPHFNGQHDVGASSMSTSWNALLPALLQRLELSRRCCHFSSLPGWTKELTKLCSLKISVRKVSKEDVFILKGLPSLFALSLFIWTAPAGRIIFDNDGFSVLKYFKFVCAAPCLKFLDAAMPNVRKLKLGFNANRMEQYNLDAARFERLTGLNEISIKIGATSVDEGERNSAHSVLTDAIGMHPSTPIINVHWVDWNFCGEDEKHTKPLEELRGQTSQKQYVTTVESSDLIFKKEAKPQASALIDTHIVERSDEHGKPEKNLEEDAKKQPDTRTYAAPDTTLHLKNIDLKLPLSEKHANKVAEKHEIDSGGYGEIDKQQQQQRLRQQQQQQQQALLMQQALQQQQYQSGVLAAAAAAAVMTQMEPVSNGNLPPGFDPSTCRSVYVGNVHPNVSESLLIEVFQSTGPVERCKLIRKEKSSFGFVDYYDRRSAAISIMTLHGRHIYGQAIKVNWAYASTQREDTSGHFHIFVGDLSSEVNDATLYACFSTYPSCSDARVMWDNKTGRSRGYGFVSFRNQQEAKTAITEMTGKWLGSRQIRCNWATKTNAEEKQEADNHNAVVLTNGSSSNAAMEANQDAGSKENPENNPDFTTVYVGNLGHEVNRDELHHQFYNLGVGAIEEVRVQQEKGFGFIRYSTHGEAALAIQMANGLVVRGKPLKCSWGNKPTPPGTSSKPLPPPVASYQPVGMAGVPQGFTAAELLAYQRQLALSQAAAGQLAGQHGLAGQVSAGLLAAGSQTLYDGYPNQSSAQQLMYYN